jgi:hypothetical protein
MYKNIIKVIYKANDIFVVDEFFPGVQAGNGDALHARVQSRFCPFGRVFEDKAIMAREPQYLSTF